ncbi:MAG TPA: LON peptidase substrate-binding domain-containing protein [Pseudomonadales bacterium]|nr:LON peptidase substrate-binding domain-containing protein [Pseudomonadales bacterium]
MSDTIRMPLFPLSTVMFPGARIPLQIFEPRYMDMVKNCMREGVPFGIVNLVAGSELASRFSELPSFEAVGCAVKIVDWSAMPHGRLGIVVEGTQKIQVLQNQRDKSNLNVGEVVLLPDEEDCQLPEEYLPLWELLDTLQEHEAIQRLMLTIDSRSALSVANHLSALLPIEDDLKQDLLEQTNPLDRLALLAEIVSQLET